MDHDLQHMRSEITLAIVFHIESIRNLIPIDWWHISCYYINGNLTSVVSRLPDVLDHKINTNLRY